MIPAIWRKADRILCLLSLFFVFCLFTQLTTQKIKILHKCIKNHDHMLYFWDNVCDRCNCYFWFWATYLTAQKIKIKKKWKKHLEISSFYKSALKIIIICYTVPKIWHVIFHLGLFFCIFTPLTAPQKIKKWKNSWWYHRFTWVTRIMIRWCTVPEIWCHEVGAMPNKQIAKKNINI